MTMKMEMLSQHEVKVLEALRDAVKTTTNEHTSAAKNSLRSELESIYHDLAHIKPQFWEEDIREITNRVYSLLY